MRALTWLLALWLGLAPAFADSAFVAPSATGTAATGQLPGTATNDDAAAGKVGEFTSATLALGSATALTSSVAKTVISISLTAGDWDVSAIGYWTGGTTTVVTDAAFSVGTTTNSFNSTEGAYADAGPLTVGISTPSATIGRYRFSLSGTTTIYLVSSAIFSVSTLSGYGFISARRAR